MIDFIQVHKVNKSKNRIPIKINDVFNEFIIVDNNYYKTKTSNHLHVKCKCSCGTESFQRIDRLVNSITRSCYSCGVSLNKRNGKNLDKITTAMFSNIKKTAVERKLEFSVTIEYLNDLYKNQNGKCAITNVDITIDLSKNNKWISGSLDRIDNTKGYIEGNLQWLHKRINIMKGNLLQLDFIGICKLISQQNDNLKDNFDPSTLNGLLCFNKRVNVKEQRLIVEEPIQ